MRRRTAGLRWAHMITTWLLVVLVATSVVLAVRLWSVAPPPSSVRFLEGGSQAYVTPESFPLPSDAPLLAPASLELLRPGAPTQMYLESGQDGTIFVAAWRTILTAIKGIAPQDLQDGSDATFASAAAALKSPCAASGAASTVCVGGIQAQFLTDLPWAALWNAASGGAWPATGPDPAVSRLVLSTGASGDALWILSASAGLSISLPDSTGEAVAAVLAQASAGTGAVAMSLVAPQGLSIPVAAGIYVPLRLPTLAAVADLPEQLAPEPLAAALFPDPLEVVQGLGSGGNVVYRDPQGRVLTVDTAAGSANYTAPPESGAGGYVGPASQLLDVARFVSDKGGWPPESLVAAITGLGGSAVGYSFGTRYLGYPVVGNLSPIFVSMQGVMPLEYNRQVPVVGAASGPPQTWIAPARVLQTVADGAFVQLPQGSVQQITDVFAAFLQTTSALDPVWAVRVDTVRAGSGLALIDAVSGDPVAFLPG